LTIDPNFSSQYQPLRLLPRYGEAARDQFQVEAVGFHGSSQHAAPAGLVEAPDESRVQRQSHNIALYFFKRRLELLAHAA